MEMSHDQDGLIVARVGLRPVRIGRTKRGEQCAQRAAWSGEL